MNKINATLDEIEMEKISKYVSDKVQDLEQINSLLRRELDRVSQELEDVLDELDSMERLHWGE